MLFSRTLSIVFLFAGLVPTWSAEVDLPLGANGSWQTLGVADVDGDGLSDVIWLEPSGLVSVWLMQTDGQVRSVAHPADFGTAAISWALGALGDLDGDHHADLAWRNTTTGSLVVWYLSATGSMASKKDFGVVPLSYELRGCGDFDRNGTKDLLWFQPSDGLVAIWRMASDRSSYTGAFPGSVGQSNWRPYRVGDFDGDGTADIFWRDEASSKAAVWYLNNGAFSDFDNLPQAPTDKWKLATVGDFNGDGRSDLAWYYPGPWPLSICWSMQGRHAAPISGELPYAVSGWYQQVSLQTCGAFSAPTIMVDRHYDGTAIITWDPVPGATGYKVRCQDETGRRIDTLWMTTATSCTVRVPTDEIHTVSFWVYAAPTPQNYGDAATAQFSTYDMMVAPNRAYAGSSLDDQINALYTDYLGIHANEEGVRYWREAISSGRSTLADLAHALEGDSLEREINAQFINVLGRTANQTELESWTTGLLNGAVSWTTLDHALHRPPAADPATPQLTDPLERQIDGLYVNSLGVHANAEGIRFWREAITSGRSTIDDLAQALAGDSLGREINALFSNVLGREANQQELESWSAGLRNGSASWDSLAQQLHGAVPRSQLTDPLDQQIDALYFDRLGVHANAEGIRAWHAAISSGSATLDDLKRALSNDSLEAEINAMFRNVLGTDADQADLARLIDGLKSGTITWADLDQGLQLAVATAPKKPTYEAYCQSVAQIFADRAADNMDIAYVGRYGTTPGGTTGDIYLDGDSLAFKTSQGTLLHINLTSDQAQFLHDNTFMLLLDVNTTAVVTDLRAIATIWHDPAVNAAIRAAVYQDIFNAVSTSGQFRNTIFDRVVGNDDQNHPVTLGQIDPHQLFFTQAGFRSPQPYSAEEIASGQTFTTVRQRELAEARAGRYVEHPEYGNNDLGGFDGTLQGGWYAGRMTADEIRIAGINPNLTFVDAYYYRAEGTPALADGKLNVGVTIEMLTEDDKLHDQNGFTLDANFGLVTSQGNVSANDPGFADRYMPIIVTSFLSWVGGQAVLPFIAPAVEAAGGASSLGGQVIRGVATNAAGQLVTLPITGRFNVSSLLISAGTPLVQNTTTSQLIAAGVPRGAAELAGNFAGSTFRELANGGDFNVGNIVAGSFSNIIQTGDPDFDILANAAISAGIRVGFGEDGTRVLGDLLTGTFTWAGHFSSGATPNRVPPPSETGELPPGLTYTTTVDPSILWAWWNAAEPNGATSFDAPDSVLELSNDSGIIYNNDARWRGSYFLARVTVDGTERIVAVTATHVVEGPNHEIRPLDLTLFSTTRSSSDIFGPGQSHLARVPEDSTVMIGDYASNNWRQPFDNSTNDVTVIFLDPDTISRNHPNLNWSNVPTVGIYDPSKPVYQVGYPGWRNSALDSVYAYPVIRVLTDSGGYTDSGQPVLMSPITLRNPPGGQGGSGSGYFQLDDQGHWVAIGVYTNTDYNRFEAPTLIEPDPTSPVGVRFGRGQVGTQLPRGKG